jgi:SAM-dependent methyltransferase
MLSLDRQNALREQYRARHPGWQPATEVFAAEVRARLSPRTRLLDLGCGRGGLIEQLDHPLNRAAGVDPDFVSVREHRLARLPRAAAASDGLPFAAGTFDLIYAAWLLEHLTQPAATFAEVSRLLRPDGAFVFITPNARHPLAWANRLAGRLGTLQGRLVSRLYGRAADDTFATRYEANRRETIDDLAASAGLRLASLRFVADPTYLALAPGLMALSEVLERRLSAERAVHLVGVLTK